MVKVGRGSELRVQRDRGGKIGQISGAPNGSLWLELLALWEGGDVLG